MDIRKKGKERTVNIWCEGSQAKYQKDKYDKRVSYSFGRKKKLSFEDILGGVTRGSVWEGVRRCKQCFSVFERKRKKDKKE